MLTTPIITQSFTSENNTYEIYIGFGSNLGNCRNYIRLAIEAFKSHSHLSLLARSSLYLTKPVGPVLDQPMFYNAAILVRSSINPLDLLDLCQEIESSAGRERIIDKGPRTLDIDLILSPTMIIASPRITLPHPQMHKRGFVLYPMLEINNELIDPRDGHPLYHDLQRLNDHDDVEQIGEI